VIQAECRLVLDTLIRQIIIIMLSATKPQLPKFGGGGCGIKNSPDMIYKLYFRFHLNYGTKFTGHTIVKMKNLQHTAVQVHTYKGAALVYISVKTTIM
jgi:hypothetical protein